VVLSQTFRAIIHSRLTVGLSKYRSQYRGADVLLFQPPSDDSEIFFTSLFGYATRRRICEHAYRRTRADLLARADELEPVLSRHGLRLRRRALEAAGAGRFGAWGAREAAGRLRASLGDLERWIERERACARA
jgi:hypothetical protein